MTPSVLTTRNVDEPNGSATSNSRTGLAIFAASAHARNGGNRYTSARMYAEKPSDCVLANRTHEEQFLNTYTIKKIIPLLI